MSSGTELWKHAKERIPGGSMLLSKRAELMLPAGWPAYFDRTSGCRVWDLDGTEYLDFGFMGIGTNILGYSHPKVDDAVRRTVDKGNLSHPQRAGGGVARRPAGRAAPLGRHGSLRPQRRRDLRRRRADRQGGIRQEQGRLLRLPRLARLVPRGEPR